MNKPHCLSWVFVPLGSVSIFVSCLMAAGGGSGHGRSPVTLGQACGSTGRSPGERGSSSFWVAVFAGQRLGDCAGGLEQGDLHRSGVRGLGDGSVAEGRPGFLFPF